MEIDREQLQQVALFLKDWGPVIASVVGAVWSILLSFIVFLARWAWRKHTERLEIMTDATKDLAVKVLDMDKNVESEQRRIWENIQALRAELEIHRRSSDTLKESLLRIEGSNDNVRSILYSDIEKLGKVDSKLEAVFRFIDAPVRRTDAK